MQNELKITATLTQGAMIRVAENDLYIISRPVEGGMTAVAYAVGEDAARMILGAVNMFIQVSAVADDLETLGDVLSDSPHSLVREALERVTTVVQDVLDRHPVPVV